MASASFKQDCPSCESPVLVRDEKMIGKKIECPKCKDKFIVKPPPPPEESEDEEEETPRAKKAKPAAKKAVAKGGDDEDDAPPQAKAKTKPDAKKKDTDETNGKKDKAGKKGKTDLAAAGAVEADSKKKKKGLSKKMTIGLALAIVGVAVLGLAGYFILGNSPTARPTPPKGGPAPPPIASAPPTKQDDDEKKDDDPDDPEKKDKKDKKKPPVVAVKPKTKDVPVEKKEPDIEELFEQPPDLPLNPAGPELTNLFPADTEQIVRMNFKAILEQNSPFRDAAFNAPGAFEDRKLRRKLSFSPLNIDEIIQADRFTPPAWSLTVVHVMENMTPKNLTLALGLQQAKNPVKGQIYYQVKNNRWLDQLGRLAPGVPPTFRQLLPERGNRPLFVRLHNPQTLVLGDESVMQAFLQEEGQFRFFGDKEDQPRTDPKKDIKKDVKKDPAKKEEPKKDEPKKEEPKKDDAKKEEKLSDKDLQRGSTFMTVKPSLKILLERWLPAEGEETKDRVLVSTATDMVAAQVFNKIPEYKGLVLHRPRPMWDLTCVLEERSPRLSYLATALVQKDSRVYQYRTDLICRQQSDARELTKELGDRTLPRVTKFLDQVLDFHIDVSFAGAKMTDIKGGTPEAAKLEVPKSTDGKPESKVDGTKLWLSQLDSTVSVNLDLALEPAMYSRVIEVMGMLMADANQELSLADEQNGRAILAKAIRELATKGLTDRLSEPSMPPGRYPPAALPRPNDRSRGARDPGQRISWMAGLLPFLGHDKLFARIQWEQSWRHPSNWLVGQTIVPQFIDPNYPLNTHYAHLPNLPIDFGATHFVGISGVGLDSADYTPTDPAIVAKRGVFNYERSASLDDVQKGRGLSNTMVVVQIPPDSLAGLTPWIAGGGSTVRGVPETNSIAPFVLSQDRDGKSISHKGQAGTYVLMADGSVRFVTSKVGDDVFKAMATYQGPNPSGFDIDKNSNIFNLSKTAPAVSKSPEPEPEKTPPKKSPTKTKKKVEPKKDDDE